MSSSNMSDSAESPSKAHPKAKFTPEEDNILRNLVNLYGENDWASISSHMPMRTTRQCRERWRYYLSPAINNSEWTEAEDELILMKHALIGSRWKKMTQFFVNRTDNAIKNRYLILVRRQNKKAKKRVRKAVTQVQSFVMPEMMEQRARYAPILEEQSNKQKSIEVNEEVSQPQACIFDGIDTEGVFNMLDIDWLQECDEKENRISTTLLKWI